MTEHKHTTRRALIPGDAPCPWFEVVAGGHVVALTNHETIAYAGARFLNGEKFCNDVFHDKASGALETRDDFAKAALTGLLVANVEGGRTDEELVKEAYDIADEMLKAREQRRTP